MPKANFTEARKKAESEGLIGSGDYLKLKEGDNRLRLLSECLPHTSMFNGNKNFKWLCYVIDRKDGKVKPFFMPHTIYKRIEALQINEDYAFEDVPMPYDLTVHAVGAGTKEVEYSLVPARKESPVTAVEHAEFAKVKPLAELKQALKDKEAKKAATAPPTDDAPPSDDGHQVDESEIPF